MAGRQDWTISVVIPTFDEESTIRSTLDQFTDLPGCWQVIVADSGSTDRTLYFARNAGATIVEDVSRGRGAAMNAGAAPATGKILLFLHADTLLPRSAHREITDALACPGVAATGFRLRMDRDEWRYRMLTPVATARFQIQRTFFGDQAIAVRREDFERIGGYHEPLLMEDVELSKRLRRRGRLELLPSHVISSARRFERGGVLRTLFKMSLFQIAYALGVSPARLTRRYEDVRSGVPMPSDQAQVIAVSRLDLVDDTGEPVDVTATSSTGPVLLVFLRWLG